MEKLLEELIEKALEVRNNSYAPYSGYRVGAALQTEDDAIFTGCNIENAAYTPTICAERTAFFKAVSEGKRKFKRIAIAGGRGEMPNDYAFPCGVCRQVMAEFCDGDFEVIAVIDKEHYKVFTLDELLPKRFDNVNLA